MATIQMLDPPEGREKADCRVMAEGVEVNQEVGRGLAEECAEGRERVGKQCSLNHFLETILLRLILVSIKDREDRNQYPLSLDMMRLEFPALQQEGKILLQIILVI